MLERGRWIAETWCQDLMDSRAACHTERISDICPSTVCIGFMDCTYQYVAHLRGHAPSQRAVYFGHKSAHLIKWKSITTLYGLIFHLYGLKDGRRHYTTICSNSNMDSVLEAMLHVDGLQYYVYADWAYKMRPWL